MKKLLIGISGGTASGKTTLAKMITEEIGKDKVLLLSLDRYYKDLNRLKPLERKKVNFDNPASLDWPLFKKQIKELLRNKKVKAPIYSFVQNTRVDYETLEPKDVIIVEGIFAFYNEEICDLMNIRIFVETPPDIRLIRRIQRDIIERKRDIKTVVGQWNNNVKPAHEVFVEPAARRAHLIVPEDPEGNMRRSVVNVIKSTIRDFYVGKKK